MSRIHRRLLGLLSIVVLIVLISPFVGGLYAKHVITHLVEEPLASNTTITITDYRLGWFTSTVKIKAVVLDTKHISPAVQPMIANATLILKHGPIIHLQNPDGSSRWVFATAIFNQTLDNTNLGVFGGPPQLVPTIDNYLKTVRATTVIEFDGGAHGEVVFPAAHVKEQTFNWDWDGCTAKYSINYSKTKSTFNTTLGKFVLSSPDISVTTTPITVSMDAYKGKHNLWLGKVQSTIPSINALNPKDPTQNFNITQWTFNWENKEDNTGELVNTSFNTQLQSLQLRNETHGPFILSLAANRLDAAATASLDELSRNFNPNDPGQVKQLSELLTAVFSKQAEIVLSTLSVKSNTWGNLEVTGKVTLPSLPPNQPNIQVAMASLLQGAVGEVNLKADATMMHALLENSGIIPKQTPQQTAASPQTPATEAPANPPIPTDPQAQLSQNPEATPSSTELANQLLDAWVAGGLLVKQDNVYTTKFELKNGTLTANGKPMTPPGH